ncbi:MAG: hypothetical protein MAG458_01509 [Nitrosopumilus sp.]|nr:hypothetical protein [Nitrosopumilus sp.]
MTKDNSIRNILVPYDDSKFAKKALAYAKGIAKEEDTKIFLLNVVDEHNIFMEQF